MDGLTAAQAAHSLGCSRPAFAVRLHRARRRLAVALDTEEAGDLADASRLAVLPMTFPLPVRPEEVS